MKILATSDIHIHYYTTYSQFDTCGLPNRLLLFLDLANDILKIARENNVDVIVLAGDIAHTPIIRSEVANVIKQFLDILSSDINIKLIITSGNHDIIVKNDTLNEMHSILTPLIPNRKNIYYCLNETELEIDNIKFHVAPWSNPTFNNFKKADVFIGHAIVNGCLLPNGREIKGGFLKQDLFDNYKLSIIGDIHKRQLHFNDDSSSCILQPGTPLQNTYSDHPDCGIWICDLKSNPEFISNYKFEHSDSYYSFIYSDNTKEEYSRKNTFVKLVSTKKSNEVEFTEKVITTNLTDVFNVLSKENDLEEIQELFNEIYKESHINSTIQTPNQITLKRLKVKNFSSIRDLDFEFQDWESLLISGSNGCGKSSFVNSIFFCLTGETTKKQTIDDIVFYGESECFVSLTFVLNKKEIILTRSRNNKSSDLCLIYDEVEHRQNTISETQKLIYSLLGVTKEELLMFNYFDSVDYKSFAKLQDSQKYSVISKLASTDILDNMRSNLKEKITSVTQKLSSYKFYLSQSKNDLEKKKQLLLDIEDGLDINLDRKEEIDSRIAQIDILLLKHSEENSKIQKLIIEQSNYKKAISYCEKELLNMKDTFLQLYNKKNHLLENKCSECNQKYTPINMQDLINDLTIKINNIKNSAENKKAEIKEFKLKLIDEITLIYNDTTQDLISEKTSCKHSLNKIHSQSINIGKLESLKESIKELNLKIEEYDKHTLDELSKLEIYKKLEKILSRDGVLATQLLKNTVDLINKELILILTDTGFFIELSNDKSFTIKVRINNSQVSPFHNLSNGEAKIVEIALVVAFVNCYCKIYGLDKSILGFIFLDELFTYLAPEFIPLCVPILEYCKVNRIIITHELELKSYFTNTILATKDKANATKYSII